MIAFGAVPVGGVPILAVVAHFLADAVLIKVVTPGTLGAVSICIIVMAVGV